jgi:anti-sigma B factor antagonist
MEIIVNKFKHYDVITIKGRIDSSQASQMAQAFEDANNHGQYNLVVDLSQLEYISSAAFRELIVAQRNSKHNDRGEILLVQVPKSIRESLDLAGFNELFKTFNNLSSAGEYAAGLAGDSTVEPPPPEKKKKRKDK